MKRLVEFFVDLFPLDAAGRRAIDETLADWRHEAATAATPRHRMLAGVLGILGVGEVLGRVGLREIGRPRTYGVCASVLVLALVFSLVMIAITRIFMLVGADATPRQVIFSLPLLLPSMLATCVPMAFLTPLRRQPAQSYVAASVVVACLAVVNLGWLTPQANQTFREVTARYHNPVPPGLSQPPPPRKGLAELTAPELVELARQGGDVATVALGNLNARLALLVLIPACALLGVQARCYVRARGTRRGSFWLAWGVGMIAWGGTQFAPRLLMMWLDVAEAARMFRGYNLWLMPTLVLAGALVIAHLARRRESRHAPDLSVPAADVV